MKKILTVGAASTVLAAMPILGVFANQTDTVVVEIEDACTVDLATVADDDTTPDVDETDTGHVAGMGTSAATSWSGDTLSGVMTNGTATQNYGQTKLRVSCNDNDGFVVSATMNNLTAAVAEDGSGNKLTIQPNAAFSGTSSGYAIKIGNISGNGASSMAAASSDWIGTTGTIVTASEPVSAGTFTVTYGVGVSATQAADTYSGTVVYGVTAN